MPVPFFAHLSDADLFPIVNIVIPAWILLVLGPRWKITQAVVGLTALLLSLLYALLVYTAVVKHLSESADFSMDTYDWVGVAKLLSQPGTVLPAWVHFVAFDL